MRSKACFYAGLLSVSLATIAVAQPKSPSEIPAEAFAQTPAISSLVLSPDGTHIAYLELIEGRKHLVIQPLMDSSRPITLRPLDEKSDYDWVYWANNDRLVFVVSFFKNRKYRIHRDTRLASIDKQAGDLQWLVKPDPTATSGSSRPRNRRRSVTQRQDRVLSWLPEEPGHILLTMYEQRARGYVVRKIDVETGNYTTVQTDIPDMYIWISDQSRSIRIGYGYRDSELDMRIQNSKGKWVSPAKTDWWKQDYLPAGFTEDPSIAYMIGPDDSGMYVLRTMRLEDETFIDTISTTGQHDIWSLANDPVTSQPAGVVFIDDLPGKKYFDSNLDLLQRSLDAALPQTRNLITSMSSNRMRLLVYASSATEPGAYFYWDRHKKIMELIAITRPGLAPELLSPARPVTYPARDGTAIPAYLITPKGQEAKDLPSIVLPHNGPHTRSDSSFNYLAHFLASRGYAVLQPNFRGSNGYGKKHIDAGHGQWGGLMLDDITDGARWLIKEGIADPDRLCIVGSLYGGYAAAMSPTLAPDLYRCAISINGPLDLPALVNNQNRNVSYRWMDSIGRDAKHLSKVSPKHQAHNIRIPMLIIQARNYPPIPEYQGSSMVSRLRRHGGPVESVRVDFDGHVDIGDVPEARLTILKATEAFLAQHIGVDSSETTR